MSTVSNIQEGFTVTDIRFRSVVFLFLVFACPIAYAQNTLSVKETLGAVLDQRRDQYGYQLQLYKRANPKTRPVLLEMLQTPHFRPHYSAILRTLGYIGKPDDVDTMVAILPEKPEKGPAKWKKHSGVGFGWNEQLTGLFDGLALMDSRGIQPASKTLKAMLKSDYWKNEYVLTIPGMGSRTMTPLESVVSKVLRAYAITEPEASTKTADAVIERFENDTEYKQWEWLLSEKRLLGHVATFHYLEHRPIREADRKAMRRYYKANRTALKKLDTYPVQANEDSRQDIAAIVREATSAYEKITKQVAMGKPVFDRLLDDGGEPVVTEKGQSGRFLALFTCHNLRAFRQDCLGLQFFLAH